MKTYEKYKPSGVEWFGDIPEHWEVRKLKYCFKFQTGFTPFTKNEEFYQNGKHIWVTIADMDGKYVSDSLQKINDKAVKEHKDCLVPKGSLLYSFKLKQRRW